MNWLHASSQLSSISPPLGPSYGGGVEKRLEIDLKKNATEPGALGFPDAFWRKLLNIGNNVNVIDIKRTNTVASFVLSESTLLVSDTCIIIIGFGKTSLIGCLPVLLDALKKKGLEVEWMQYSRRRITSWGQTGPLEEYAALQTSFPEGNLFILGPLNGNHFWVYLMDKICRPEKEETDQLLQLFMHDIEVAPPVADSSVALRKNSRMEKIFEGFDLAHDTPEGSCCGYSANAIGHKDQKEAYVTVHIPPQSKTTFAFFETNLAVESYEKIIRTALDVFKPCRFALTMLLDGLSLAGQRRASGLTVGAENIFEGYDLHRRTVNEFEPGYFTIVVSFHLHQANT